MIMRMAASIFVHAQQPTNSSANFAQKLASGFGCSPPVGSRLQRTKSNKEIRATLKPDTLLASERPSKPVSPKRSLIAAGIELEPWH
jgi:hypothetical protein